MKEERKRDGCSSLFFGTSEGVARIDLSPERSAAVNEELTRAASEAPGMSVEVLEGTLDWDERTDRVIVGMSGAAAGKPDTYKGGMMSYTPSEREALLHFARLTTYHLKRLADDREVQIELEAAFLDLQEAICAARPTHCPDETGD